MCVHITLTMTVTTTTVATPHINLFVNGLAWLGFGLAWYGCISCTISCMNSEHLSTHCTFVYIKSLSNSGRSENWALITFIRNRICWEICLCVQEFPVWKIPHSLALFVQNLLQILMFSCVFECVYVVQCKKLCLLLVMMMTMVNSFWIVNISCTFALQIFTIMNANQMRNIRLLCIRAISLLMQLVLLLLLLLFMYRMCRGTNDRKKCGEKQKHRFQMR